MPIDTDSKRWQTAERGEPPVCERVLSFLRSHSGQAFHIRELSDEVMDTNWEAIHDEDRERGTNGDTNGNISDHDVVAKLTETKDHQRKTNHLRVHLSRLEEDGIIEGREVPIGKTDIPYDEGNVAFYALA